MTVLRRLIVLMAMLVGFVGAAADGLPASEVASSGFGVYVYDVTTVARVDAHAAGTAAARSAQLSVALEESASRPAEARGAFTTSPDTFVATNRLAIGPAGRDNPWPAGNNGVGMPAPEGMRIQMAMSPGQTNPGGFGTLDDISDVAFVRNNLAVRPDWKPEISHVQTFEVPAGTRVQVGPQSYGGVTYPGGANQVEILNYGDRSSLIPIGGPRAIS